MFQRINTQKAKNNLYLISILNSVFSTGIRRIQNFIAMGKQWNKIIFIHAVKKFLIFKFQKRGNTFPMFF